jgi:hypothetical protein
MKKILVFALALSLVLPAAAFAKAEFSLGGFIKLDAFWDSTQNGNHLNGVVQRSNDPNRHGRMKFTAQASRINFTIKGPKVFGAQTTGFIEMDFDATERARLGVDTASNSYTPRLRHAMFRLNWPETELLFGQYWSLFSSWYAESAQPGPFQISGTPTARLPQIRITQKFLSDWSVIALVGDGNNNTGVFGGDPYGGVGTNSECTETPQIQGSLKYAHDWWGKAAYYGHPIPFTAQITGGWQRNIARSQNLGALQSINGTAIPAGAAYITNKYASPWLAMGTLFIPVLPTHSANLAGTASLLAQFWIGQGVAAFGFTGDQTAVFKLNNLTGPGGAFNPVLFDAELLKRWGGFVEGQYYFTNQWYCNLAYSLSKTYGVDQSQTTFAGVPVAQYYYNNVNGQFSTQQEVDFTLWYRPVQALKFGLQYSFVQANFWTRVNSATTATFPAGNGPQTTNYGTEHRVEFVGYFYF